MPKTFNAENSKATRVAKTLGLAILLFGMASVALAGGDRKPPPPKWCPPPPKEMKAPEIDPSSAMAGLTMLLGGLAVVRGHRPKNKE
jgi:hypothetical protein